MSNETSEGDGVAVSFRDRLRSLREAAGLTQEELASRAGLSSHAVSALERGTRRRPHPHTVRSLSDALELPKDERAALLAAVPERVGTASPAPTAGPGLPAPPTPLVGRERDVAAVQSMLETEGARLVTLTGPGGVGKSRLALEVADRTKYRFSDGAAFVALAPVGDPDFVVPTLAQALGLREAGGLPAGEQLRGYLADKRLLLVLDNLEHLLGFAPELATLLTDCPSLLILVTSRASLRLRGEQEYQVGPLSVPDPTQGPKAEAVAASPAADLFIERARAANPAFSVNQNNAAAVAAICRRLDGLPLALELAAAKTRLLGPTDLLSRLEEALEAGGARDLPERQRTMRGTLDWSHDLLSEDQEGLFRRLSVFLGGFTLDAAEAVGAASEAAAADVLGLLGVLVEQSLVVVKLDALGGTRYGMLEPIRQYALGRLRESGEEEPVRERYAAYYRSLAERAERELKGPRQAEWMDLLERENANLRAALLWTAGRTGEEGLRLAVALRRFWSVRGHLEEGRRWLESALASCPATPPSLRAKALGGLGEIALERGERGPAKELFGESLALGRSSEDPAVVASALRGLAEAALWERDHRRAALLCEESVALQREARDEQGLATSLNISGLVEIQRGDHERALALLEEGLTSAREAGDEWAVAVNLGNLGWAHLGRGDHELAARSFGESLERHLELGEKWLAADCLDGLARVASEQGNPVRAARSWGVAEALSEDIGATTAPLDRAAYERHLVEARARLGGAAFAAAWAEGRAMTPEEAVEEVLDARE